MSGVPGPSSRFSGKRMESVLRGLVDSLLLSGAVNKTDLDERVALIEDWLDKRDEERLKHYEELKRQHPWWKVWK